MDRLTQFPVLDGDKGAARAIVHDVDTVHFPNELAAVSWALLLSSCTTEQSPVFLFNDAPVQADLFARTVQPVTPSTTRTDETLAQEDPKRALSNNYTAVVVEESIFPDHLSNESSPTSSSPSPSPPSSITSTLSSTAALSWTINRKTQMSVLNSTTGMDATALQRLSSQLKQIVQEQVTQSGMRAELPATELPAMSISNPSPAVLPGPQLLHELALSGSHDANNAIEFLAADGNTRCLSYHALDQLSSRLAAEIVQASAATGNDGRRLVVPVLLPQSLELYIAWLGILKAGGAFCPLNTDAPPDRIEFILQDVAASVVVTQNSLAARVPQSDTLTAINVEDVVNQVVTSDISSPAVTVSPADLAYVMYTSGSTGRPKGVGISHLAATQSLLAHNDLIPHFNRFLQFASPTFDVEQMLLDISRVMTEMRVDAAELTPTVAGELLRTRAAAPCLRVLLTIGEMLTKHVVEEFGQSESSDGILHGMYGPTEAAIHCTAATHFNASSAVNLIGQPFKTVSAFIMSLESDDKSAPSELQTLPIGQIGELVVGGPQLADGYINRPEENAKAFIDHPIYGRLYRTGDKARMSANGDIECFGRISSGQVKLRGQRIELGEIENVICKSASVRSAVVIVSGGSLAAYVLLNDKGATDRELRDTCRQWLPRFMVPGEFIILDQFPQLPSGKIDRKGLEADFVRRRNVAQSMDQQAFRDEIEETIASCVSDVLGKKVPATDSLVSAGLDSLAAIRLASHLLDAGIRLDVARILESDCVDGIWHLAKELEASESTEDTQTGLDRIRQLVADAGAARIEALGLTAQTSEIQPCNHIQQAMILETARDTKAYSNWIELEFQQSVTSSAAHGSFAQIFHDNALLRSGFVEIGLKDNSYAMFTWNELDNRMIQTSEVFDYDVSLISDHDLLYPVRVQLKEMDGGVRALVHIHHALYDGWSWQLILKDLQRILVGEEIPPKPAYNVVTDFFIEYKLSESANESSRFWRDQLQGSSALSFPSFHSKTNVPSSTKEASRVLDVSLPKLNDLSQSLRVSRQTVFQAAFCYILSTYLGSDDVIIGTVFSGRTLPVKGIESVLGPCIRTLPTRVNLDKMQNVTDLMLAIQNMNRKSLEHGSLPLQDIKKASGIDPQRSLFDTALVWQESIYSDDQHALFSEVGAAEFLEFAFLLDFEPREDNIRAKMTYQESILPHEQVQILLEQIDSVASVLIDNPTLSINEIASSLPSSRLSVLNADFETRTDLPSLVSGVESLALVDPTRTAIEILPQREYSTELRHVECISYGQLQYRSTRIAHYLLQVGVKNGDLVAIFLDKSMNSFISILALAKIGAGLLPLAHDCSLQSTKSILASAKARFCIVNPSASTITSELTALETISHILLPDSLDSFEETAPLTKNDGFHITCSETLSSSNGLMDHATFSSYNLQSHLDALADYYPASVGSKLMHTSSLTSIGFFVDLFFAWHAGITFCSAFDDLKESNIQHIVNSMSVTHLHLTPSLASHLAPEDVSTVRHLLTSGEPLKAKVHRDWAGKGISQGFSSEGLSGVATIYTNLDENVTCSSIGAPLKNTSAMIIAEKIKFELLPRGAIGEICFGGTQVGHDSHPASVSAGFIDHPKFGPLYRTGVIGRIFPDGGISLLPHFKISGEYVAVDEIDRALLLSEMVQDSTTVVLNNPITNQQQLATVWVPSKAAKNSAVSGELEDIVRDLFHELTTKLPTSSVPSLLVPMDTIPMSKSYIRDHARIQEEIQNMGPERLAAFSLQLTGDDSDAALNEVEQRIAGALSAVTGADQQSIHKHTSFYKLGLDSLSAISLSRKLQESGFGRLPVSTILQRSSVAQLATVTTLLTNGHVSYQPTEPEEPSSVFDEQFLREVNDEFKAGNASVHRVYPCTPLQEAMLAAKSDADSAYFNHLLLRVNTSMDALKSAWDQMLQRHDILRTCFKPTTDKQFAYAQVVLDSASLPWDAVEVSSQGIDYDVEKRKLEFEVRSPVDGTLPYSLTAYTNPAIGATHLLLSIHHALYDGEGIAQLLHELQTLLAGQGLPESTSFHRFIDYMLSVSTDTSNKYWDRYLSGVSPSLLSTPELKESVDQSASQQIQVNLNGSFASFKHQCQDLSVTPLNVFHAAWARLLSFYADSPDVCFGNVYSCRTIPLEGADRIVGPCFNTLPMRVKFSSTSTNDDIMKLSQKHNSDILPHQLTPLRQIQKRVLNGGSRLFDTLVILQTRGTELDPQYWELLSDEGNMGFPLICEVIPDELHDTIQICLHFQSSHLDRADAERLAQDFVALVEHTTQYPSSQASDKKAISEKTPQVFERKPLVNGTLGASTIPQKDTRPWSYQEEALRDILCQFSNVEPEAVSLHTTIFQLGLDSINAVQISGKMRRLGYKISAGDILEAASIDKIALLLDTSEKNAKEEDFDFSAFENQHLPSVCKQLGISSEEVQSLRPCTPVQNGMLALFAHSSGSMYFNRMALKSTVPLDRGLLKEAWSTVMSQHEMLRTGFIQLHDQQHPFAMITYQPGIELPWYEVSESAVESPSIQEKRIFENFHRPPWEVIVESADKITTVHFSALHAIYDAQSLGSLFSDVMSAYEGKALAQPSSISATLGPILVESQKQRETSQEFWQGLAPEVHPTKVPDLNPIRTEKKELLESSIRCSESLATLEDSCRELGVTLQAAGQVAWARLLSAYTGEQNVVFGTVLSGRNLSTAAQDAIFPCLVTVPSPHQIGGTNRELLERTLKRNASLVKHQFTPLAQIQRWLGSDEPLFDTLFVYQKFSSNLTDTRSWEVTDEDTRIDYPMSIELVPHLTELEIRISYRSDIVPENQAKILLEQYNQLLKQTVFSPDTSSDDYLSLGNQLLSVTPAKEKSIPTSVSLLHQFVEENAQRVPEKPALEFASGTSIDNLHRKVWTYCEFNEDGNRVAHFLQEKGVTTGAMVAICFDKCPEASIAILGILKAGCAYVAIDPSAPISRKQFILGDSNSKLLLCNSARKADLMELSGVDVQVLDEPGLFGHYSPEQPSLSREIQPDDTCYCLYTSGTTGTPKGCELTHDNAVQAMLAFQRLFSPHWDEDSRWLQFASFHFDVSVLEQYWSWSVGICVTSCPRDLLFEDLPGMIQKLQITHIDLTPSLARLVHPDEVPSLCRGVFITGGEALKQEILDAWGKHGVIYNGYGPTEVTIGCTMLPRMRANDKPSNIGPQFDNVGSYVFRPNSSTPVLRGGLGELCVSGPLVGKGYLNRAELTEERFQTLPEWGDRIYRTGDLVRILHDDSFQFLGRIDDQVKLRGQRLEIGEINEVIKQSTSELNEVATLVIKHPKQSKDQLVSFVTKVGTDKKASNVEVRSSVEDREFLSTIKSACHTHMPGYMVPTHMVPMTRFPLSANNKADMKVLKAIYQDLSLEDIQNLTAMTVDQTAKSAQEEKIISILATFIGSSESTISSWSSIYELGLDSISVLSFARSLREAGFSQAQPSLIMKHPTVAGLATALQESKAPTVSYKNLHRHTKQGIEAFAHRNSHAIIESIGVLEGDVEQIAPCTPLQEGIIYHFLSSTTPLYCSSFTFELHASVDTEKLQSAWLQAQTQVQVLRARFAPSPDGYAQIVLKKNALPWFHREVESDEAIESSRRQELQRWISGLDSLMTQLWEVGLIVSPEKRVLCLNIFHALYDGNSLRLLLELVARIYLNEKASSNPPNFLDVLHLGPLCKDPSEKEFWKEHLANCQNKPLPKSDSDSDSTIVQKIEITSTESLDHLRRSLNITEQAILHACWLLTLHRQYSFVPPLGIIASGRTIDVPGIADVIGPLFNTIPSNVQLHGLKSWLEVAKRCHEYHASTIPFQYTALRDIVKWLGKNPDERLFESLFVFQRDNGNGESPTSKIWTTLDSEAQHEYPLAFEVARNGNESLTITLAAKTSVLSSNAAQEILSQFQDVLSDFAQNPEKELPYMNGIIEETPVQTNDVTVEQVESAPVAEINGDSHFNWTPQACTIRDIIATLAGVDVQSISAETSIFEVGLDSIDAIKLSSRLSKSGIKLPVSAIMRHRNVKAMTAQLVVEKPVEQNGTYPLLGQMEKALTEFLERENLVPQGACQILPATPIQEAMMAEMSSSELHHYYNHEILQLEPNVDLQRLQEAWRAVVKSHPILRTSFVEVWDPKISASYAQVVHSEDTFDFQSVELRGKNVESIIETQRLRAITQLGKSPLLTLTTAIDGENRYLILSIAHALYDGWSINLLHEDVSRSYRGEDCARPRSDSILEQILESSGDRSLKFWRATLSNCSPVSFPPGNHAEEGSNAVHRAEKQLPVSVEKAEAFCRRNGITMQALLVSCWSLVLATHVKKLDVIFGLVLSGRNVADSENVMFPTMNTVAMRVILHGTRLELVKYVQETLLEMSEHQHFPLRRARPNTRSQQLFDTLFIYQKRPSDSRSTGPVLYKSTGGASDVEYPVCVEVEGVENDLVGRVACRGSVLGEEDTFVLLEHLGEVLPLVIDEELQQTVEFAGENLKICGHSVVQDIPEEGAQNDVPQMNGVNGHTEWSPIESTIRNVLSVVSGVPEDSIHKTDNIFQLGLDSISAIKVAALLKKQTVRLAVSDMLREGTIEKMARAANNSQAELTRKQIANALDESLHGIDVISLAQSYGIAPENIQRALPATAGQSYFLAMHALNPEVFYPSFYYMASDSLDRHALENAWTRLAEQTPMLRTAFMQTSDRKTRPFVQVILKSTENSVFWYEDLHRLHSAPQTERGFGSIPATLHACQTTEGTAIILHIHHALYDAVSLPSIIDRLSELCIDAQSESRSVSGDLSDLVALQHLHSPVDVRRQFWQRYLGQISIPEVEDKQLDGFGTIQHFYRPGLVPNMSRVEVAAKRLGLSVQSIFLAVYARVHAQVFATGSVDNENTPLVVGLYLANRSHAMEGLSELMAPTVNIVPLRLDVNVDNGPDSLFLIARKIQDDINEISRIEHASVSLMEIAEWTGVRISTCVNFLRLPELAESEPLSNGSNGDRVKFKSIQRSGLADLADLEKSNSDQPNGSQTNGDTAAAPGPAQMMAPSASTAVNQDIFMVSDVFRMSTDGGKRALMQFLHVQQPTIDVEAAVREGHLDFGLFAPNARLGRHDAERAIERMRQEMVSLTESGLS
ncbi:hypothetical protein N7532_003437 [Penicillium argentinense]|uniref:Nonribosomal peptide synthetase sidC n=1 Tax=Penicillium argentinense TaxID=1131581 RepID=A0A9W9FMG9_9EURO|nr:uncharacterized protein N7532_003437 [Penicillium argentinense]KAJ5102908.1 hypothetical protein N7532_003437 [Penicillium argentinense]